MTRQSSVRHCNQSGTVEKEAYFNPEYVALEKRRLWPRVWQIACRLEELPEVGSYITYEITDESVVVVRAAEDRINAFYNVCRHRGRQITSGCGTDKRLRCPFHGWIWDLDGRNTYVTTREDWGGMLDQDDLSLPRVRCDIWGGWVFINLDPNAESLKDYLGDVANILALQLHIERNSESMGLHGKEAVDDGCIDRDNAGAVGFVAARGERAHARAVHAGASGRVGEPVFGRVAG